MLDSLVTFFRNLFLKIWPTPQGPDSALNVFRRDLNRALMALPSTYSANVRSYRESTAFPGGSPTTLVATLTAPEDDVVSATKKVNDVIKYMPGVHIDMVRWPADNSVRVPGICRDA